MLHGEDNTLDVTEWRAHSNDDNIEELNSHDHQE